MVIKETKTVPVLPCNNVHSQHRRAHSNTIKNYSTFFIHILNKSQNRIKIKLFTSSSTSSNIIMRLSITAAAFLFCSCAQGFAPSLSSSRQSSTVVQHTISSQWTMDEPVPEVSFFCYIFDHSTCHDKIRDFVLSD
jgi:hypothetical protein